jgi:drug/metabolite transporter (DMT)-like permease
VSEIYRVCRQGMFSTAVWFTLSKLWMWLGIFFMTIGFFALLMALSLYGVSYIVPSTALSYPVAGLGGKWLLGERVSRSGWMAIGLVSVGVLMVLLSKS